MAAVKALLRLLSLLFHLLLTLFLLGVSAIAMASGRPTVTFGMLPWSGDTLINVVFFSALFGLITVILAILGKLRVLFLLWAIAVAAILVRGYVFTGYRFTPGEVSWAVGLIIGSLIAVLGAWFQMWAVSERKMRY